MQSDTELKGINGTKIPTKNHDLMDNVEAQRLATEISKHPRVRNAFAFPATDSGENACLYPPGTFLVWVGYVTKAGYECQDSVENRANWQEIEQF